MSFAVGFGTRANAASGAHTSLHGRARCVRALVKLAFLVAVAQVRALERRVPRSDAAFVQRDEEVRAVVTEDQRDPCSLHLLMRHLHLCGAQPTRRSGSSRGADSAAASAAAGLSRVFPLSISLLIGPFFEPCLSVCLRPGEPKRREAPHIGSEGCGASGERVHCTEPRQHGLGMCKVEPGRRKADRQTVPFRPSQGPS